MKKFPLFAKNDEEKSPSQPKPKRRIIRREIPQALYGPPPMPRPQKPTTPGDEQKKSKI